MPIERLPLRQPGPPLIFTHPAISTPLVIYTGAREISWSYQLNTSVQSTYGGQVVQILSVFVGPITITGQALDNPQLKEIYDWFLNYMQLAGYYNRNEQAIKFEYPERGWSFYIQVTNADNFAYDRDIVSPDWTIQAEVVADNDLNYLAQYTMSQFTEQAFDPSMFDVGFRPNDPRNDPLSTADPTIWQRIGDNFQSLIGAWASGDFAHWAFDATQQLKQNKLKDSREYWTEVFGSDFLTQGNASTPTGAFTYNGPANPTGDVQLAGLISDAFESHGVPGQLGVATALHESSLNPNQVQHGCTSGACGIGLFQVNGDGTGADSSLAVKQAGLHRNEPNGITKYYSARAQAEAAAQWFARAGSDHPSIKDNMGLWALVAQRPKGYNGAASDFGSSSGDGKAYVDDINNVQIPRAKRLIQQFNQSAPANSTGRGVGTFAALVSTGLSYAGPDQGIDFTGTGDLYAVADGVITFVSTSSGWPGGGLVVLKLDKPVGRTLGTFTHVYYAEAIKPKVSRGDRVQKGRIVASLSSSYPGTEIGWARDDVGTAYGSVHDGKNGNAAPYGGDFGEWVKTL